MERILKNFIETNFSCYNQIFISSDQIQLRGDIHNAAGESHLEYSCGACVMAHDKQAMRKSGNG